MTDTGALEDAHDDFMSRAAVDTDNVPPEVLSSDSFFTLGYENNDLSGNDFARFMNGGRFLACIINPRGKILSINRNGARILGRNLSETAGRDIFALLPRDISERFGSLLQKAIKNQRPMRRVFILGRHAFESVLSPFFNDERTIDRIGIRCSMLSFSPKLANNENTKKPSTAMRSNIFENLPRIAVQGYGTDGTILYWNHASEDLYGYSTQEAIGSNVFDLIVPDETREQIRASLWFERDMPSAAEIQMKNKDGDLIPVFSSHVPFEQEGSEPEVYCFDIDLREIKRAQAGMMRSGKLATVGTLASGIAHQFNNINSIVLGNISLAMRDPAMSQKTHERLEKAYQAVQRSAGLTHNLLAFSRREEGKKTVADLTQVARDTVNIIRRQLEVEGIEVNISPTPTPMLEMDIGQIEQAILNLLLNARDALRSEKKKLLSIEVGEKDGTAFINVSDSGPGIPEGDMSKIFEPFYTTKTPEVCGSNERQGSGLGLNFCETVIRRHGGHIQVSNNAEGGATFIIWLPLTKGKESVDTHSRFQDESITITPNAKVLVVDDEEKLAEMLHDIVSSEGLSTEICENGESALDKLREKRYDLLITDIKMPVMNGIDLIQLAKGLPDESRPAILVTTGVIGNEEKKRCLDLGAAEIIMKPFDINELTLSIKRALATKP